MGRLNYILFLGLLSLSACAVEEESFEDPNASFLSESHDGKSDVLGVPTDEIEGVLHYANTLTLEELDNDVLLDIRAARNIVTVRVNTPFTSLAQLDAVPWVGPAAFRNLLAYTQANPPLLPVEYCGDGVLSGTEECDDGNGLSMDGCSASCEVETITFSGGVHNLGGFRRLMGTFTFDRYAGNSMAHSHRFFAKTDVTLRIKMHDGSGGVPRAITQARHNHEYGTEDVVPKFAVYSLVAPFEKVFETSGREIEVELPAGPYRISQTNDLGYFHSYKYDFVLDLEILGETSDCLRRNGCDSEYYYVEEFEGVEPSYGHSVNAEANELAYPSSYDVRSWPIEVGKTTRFMGDMYRSNRLLQTSRRTKYFLFRIQEPTRLKLKSLKVLDWSNSSAQYASTITALHRHDITKPSVGYRMPNQQTYDLEPGDYVFQLTAKVGPTTATAVKTTFEINFEQTPL